MLLLRRFWLVAGFGDLEAWEKTRGQMSADARARLSSTKRVQSNNKTVGSSPSSENLADEICSK